MILFEKYGQHQPLNRQSERYAREGIDLECVDAGRPGGRLRGDAAAARRADPRPTCSRPSACMATRPRCRCWPRTRRVKVGCGHPPWGEVYVRDDQPFAGPAPPAAVFFYSRDRTGEHPERHLADYAGHTAGRRLRGLQPAVQSDRQPGPIIEAPAGLSTPASSSSSPTCRQGARQVAHAPLAIEAVKRIDAMFDIEREINGKTPRNAVRVRNERSRAAGHRSRSLDAPAARQALARAAMSPRR